ncbi:MAG: toprim domain-containing protein [Magnetococcales bacterium]|nr:toprim domain-containing protein [Magnetococcales bacterium]
MADILELKRRLTDDVTRVAEYLLPGGKRVGQEWEAGSISGDRGKSLKLCLSGSKAGVWSDFATGDGGDLIDLWRICRSLTVAEALTEIRSWYGIKAPTFDGPRKSYRRPDPPKPSPHTSHPVWEYLIEQRGLSLEALEEYRVLALDQVGPWKDGDKPYRGNWIGFQSFHGDALKLVKYLNLARDKAGKKICFPEPGCEPVLFGWQAIPNEARSVVITEGEIDAITAWEYGHPALSVPFGGGTGGKQQWIEAEFDRLQRFETIFLCLDNDEAGKAATAELIDRLGRHRCRVVTLPEPHKDLNACLTADVSPEVIEACFRNSKSQDPDELCNASEFLEDVIKAFYPDGSREPGMPPPFGRLEGKLLFRPGELTVWTGGTGSGKSQLLGFSMAKGMAAGERVLIASLEMRADQTLKRLAKQITGLDVPSKDYLAKVHDFYAEHLWLFTVVGKASVARLIEVFDYARRRYGVTQFVVDSLMRTGVGGDDYKAQEQAVFDLTSFAVNNAVHVHLVAHARKTNQNAGWGQPIGAEEIKGTSEIGSNASTVIVVTRDRKHEQKLAKAEDDIKRGGCVSDIEDLRSKPGVYMAVPKQRNGDWDGSIPLWFDRETFQYRDRSSKGPESILPADQSSASSWGDEGYGF